MATIAIEEALLTGKEGAEIAKLSTVGRGNRSTPQTAEKTIVKAIKRPLRNRKLLA